MTLKFKRLHPDAVLPTYAHAGDSGMDLCARQKYSFYWGFCSGSGI